MRLPRWKKEQKEKKRQKLATKMKFLGVAIVLGLLTFAIFSFLKIYTTSVLPKNGRVTVVLKTEPFRVLTFDREGKVVFLQLPDNLSPGSLQEFLGAPVVSGNLNSWDRLRIWWKIKSAKTNMVKTIDLRKIAPAKIDLELAGVFRDAQIAREHLTIEVLNGSAKPGIANRVTRLITNLGGTVISVGNSEKESNRCLLKAESQVLKSQTAQRLKGIYNCQEMTTQALDSRADLQLIVGLDYWQKLNER